MPHFVIDCSEDILEMRSANEIMATVFNIAESSKLFNTEAIKVRVKEYKYFSTGRSEDSFLHVFANIMEGRLTDHKSKLSKDVVSALNELLPDLDIVSMNVREFEKATYCNKSML